MQKNICCLSLGVLFYAVTAVAQESGGRPLTATAGGDPNGDTNTSTDRPPYVGRDTYTGPNLLTADIRLTRDIPLYRDRAALRLMFEAFNATTRVFTPNATFLAPHHNLRSQDFAAGGEDNVLGAIIGH